FAVGKDAAQTLLRFAGGAALPAELTAPLEPGEYLCWTREGSRGPSRVRAHPSRLERKRHRRKYSEGELPPERSFYFRGPEGKLNLRAQNLMMFIQIGEGIDDKTWNFHLRAHDYSQWFGKLLKDNEPASAAEQIENAGDADASQ